MAKKRRAPAVKGSRTSTVYVIELSRDAVAEPCALAPLYVGQTAHEPEVGNDGLKRPAIVPLHGATRAGDRASPT